MLTDNELWEKIKSGESPSNEDLGNQNRAIGYGTVLYYGSCSYYCDGINYYDRDGNSVTEKVMRLLNI